MNRSRTSNTGASAASPAAKLLLCLLAAALAGCASPLRYVDTEGKTHPGTINPMNNSITADIDGRIYRGHFNVDLWGQARSTLAASDKALLYCKFAYKVRKVSGSCATPVGRQYDFESE